MLDPKSSPLLIASIQAFHKAHHEEFNLYVTPLGEALDLVNVVALRPPEVKVHPENAKVISAVTVTAVHANGEPTETLLFDSRELVPWLCKAGLEIDDEACHDDEDDTRLMPFSYPLDDMEDEQIESMIREIDARIAVAYTNLWTRWAAVRSALAEHAELKIPGFSK